MKLHLSDKTIDEVVSCLQRFMRDESVAPGDEGKKAFISAVLSRSDFFPEGLMREIDAGRGKLSIGEYLSGHERFYSVFGQYLERCRSGSPETYPL